MAFDAVFFIFYGVTILGNSVQMQNREFSYDNEVTVEDRSTFFINSVKQISNKDPYHIR
jgi:hypothetical protein